MTVEVLPTKFDSRHKLNSERKLIIDMEIEICGENGAYYKVNIVITLKSPR